MACIKWSQPILTFFRWDIIPAGHFSQRSLSRNPKIDPIFSSPPNHTLWKPWPVAHLPFIGCVQVGGALTLCTCSTPSKFVSFWPSHHFYYLCIWLILLYVLVDIYLLWREGCVGFWAHIFFLSSLLGLGIAWAKAFIFLLSPCFSSPEPWAFWPLILLYHFIVSAITLPLSLFLITRWTCKLMFLPCQLISSSIFCSRLSWPTFHIFTSFGLVGQHSYHASPFYYFIPWISSAHLFLLYLFYSYGLFAKFFGPFTTSLPLIILLSLLAIKPAH